MNWYDLKNEFYFTKEALRYSNKERLILTQLPPVEELTQKIILK